MLLLERIPAMSEESLRQLIVNARDSPSLAGSNEVMVAAEAELSKRKAATDRRKQTVLEEIAHDMSLKPLADRIQAALEASPPSESQISRLRLIHTHPNLDQESLARIAGDAGPGAFNMIIGAFCKERAEYLPPPEIAPRRGEPFWSGIICDIEPQSDENGRVTHGWRLKPETIVALRRLGLVSWTVG